MVPEDFKVDINSDISQSLAAMAEDAQASAAVEMSAMSNEELLDSLEGRQEVASRLGVDLSDYTQEEIDAYLEECPTADCPIEEKEPEEEEEEGEEE